MIEQGHGRLRDNAILCLRLVPARRFTNLRSDHRTSTAIPASPVGEPTTTGAAMSFFTRDECLKRLRAQVAAGRPIIGGGAGTGISAKCAEAGGIDLIIIYNSGRYRMAGRGSLAGAMPDRGAQPNLKGKARGGPALPQHTPGPAGGGGARPL